MNKDYQSTKAQKDVKEGRIYDGDWSSLETAQEFKTKYCKKNQSIKTEQQYIDKSLCDYGRQYTSIMEIACKETKQ